MEGRGGGELGREWWGKERSKGEEGRERRGTGGWVGR